MAAASSMASKLRPLCTIADAWPAYPPPDDDLEKFSSRLALVLEHLLGTHSKEG